MFTFTDEQRQDQLTVHGKEGGEGCSLLATVTTILEDWCLFKLTEGYTSCTSVLISWEYFYNIKLRSLTFDHLLLLRYCIGSYKHNTHPI